MLESPQVQRKNILFIRNMYVYVLLYAISIYYVYLLCVLESCVMCICMYPCSKHDTCIYVFVFALCYAMLIVDPCFTVVIFLLRKTGASVIVQVRSDAG